LALRTAQHGLYHFQCDVNPAEVVQLKEQTNHPFFLDLVVGEEGLVQLAQGLEGIKHENHPKQELVVLSGTWDLFFAGG